MMQQAAPNLRQTQFSTLFDRKGFQKPISSMLSACNSGALRAIPSQTPLRTSGHNISRGLYSLRSYAKTRNALLSVQQIYIYPPIISAAPCCFTHATRRKTCWDSNRSWMKVRRQVSTRLISNQAQLRAVGGPRRHSTSRLRRLSQNPRFSGQNPSCVVLNFARLDSSRFDIPDRVA